MGSTRNRTRAFVIAAALAAGMIALAATMQWREAMDDKVKTVILNPDDPAQSRVGELVYRGGLDIPRMGQDLGGLSALRWDAQSGRLLALTDDARFVWIAPREDAERLVGIETIEVGDLLDLQGEALAGKAQGDSESLTRSASGGWLVGFERDHRVWRYPTLSGLPEETGIDPVSIMGALEPNGGTETLALDERALLICAERFLEPPAPNCFWQTQGMGPSAVRIEPPQDMRGIGAVATDADAANDATLFVLFRSYTSSQGNVGGITVGRRDGTFAGIATFRAPLNVDNFEGLAVREEGEKTFLYIVSDDNFSSSQRTLLMKFEWAPAEL
ncbi:MAG: esterase-like activity of phytase family protein [Erythrobacter sp.]|nr:esterase-like activity of phytase family protein [Erythrobacter sp.]